MSPPNRPFASQLPGVAGLKPVIDEITNTASFTNDQGMLRTFTYEFFCLGSGVWLNITADDGSVCSFEPCPAPHNNLWFATGLMVCTRRVGIASQIYALVRDLLAAFHAAITPSSNLFPDGVALWSRLDPGVQFVERSDIPGYYRPR